MLGRLKLKRRSERDCDGVLEGICDRFLDGVREGISDANLEGVRDSGFVPAHDADHGDGVRDIGYMPGQWMGSCFAGVGMRVGVGMARIGECSIGDIASLIDSGVFVGRYGLYSYPSCGTASNSIETASSSVGMISYSSTTSRCSGSV